MKQRVAAYLQQAFYQPLARYPQAQVAARDYYRQTSDFTVPGSAFQNTQGALAGNAQGRNLTAFLPDAAADGRVRAFYPVTPFNAFRYETNRLRSMVLSSPESVFPTLNPPNPAAASGDITRV